MRISFSEIDTARRNRSRFVTNKLAGKGGGFNTKTFYFYLVNAVYWYHKPTITPAFALDRFVTKAEEKLQHLQRFEQRLVELRGKLHEYFQGFQHLGWEVIETKKRVSLKSLPPHIVSGQIPRFDLVPTGGYAATFFQMEMGDWKDEVRWPLIQAAIADEMGCGVDEVKVGIYFFEDALHDHVTYSADEIAEATEVARELLDDVSSRLPSS